MGRIIISHLGPAQETEIRFLLDLAEGFLRRGHQPIIWSAIYDRRFAPYYLPLNWRLKELRSYFADLSPRDAPGLDVTKWRERVEVLIKQDWNETSRESLLQDLISMSVQVVETFDPDFILSWNSLCPHTGIAFDLNRAAGRRSWLIEKAVFPHTWFVEPGGLVGHSIYAGTTLETHISPSALDHYAALGRAYLARTNFGAYNRYAQVQTSEAFDRLDPDRRPHIAFFPPDDGTLGFVPADGDDRKATVPHYENSFAAAKALSKAHDGITIYKVHPSLAQHPHDTTGYPDLHVIDYDFRKVIAWADIVATTGSGLEFIAMAMGRPVLLLGNDILAGKGIAYEGQSPETLPAAIAAAQAREGFDERLRRFHAYCGWLATEILISPNDAERPCRTPDEVAEEISDQYLSANEQNSCATDKLPSLSVLAVEGTSNRSAQDTDNEDVVRGTRTEAEFWDLRADLLTPKWREKLAKEAPVEASLRDKPKTPLLTDRAEVLEAVADCANDLILDFDNTLILQNSTERWLDALRPKTLAFLVCLVCDVFVRFAARRKWCKADRWRDQVRVAATTVLFPWNLVWWRVSAKKRMGRYLNTTLADAVAKTKAKEISIVTFGFQHVVAPLVAQLPFKTRLVASEAFSAAGNLRKRGKVDALLQHLGPERLKTALFITDSRDDQEVIDHAGRAALLQWAPYPSPAFARTYFPMRYAVQGKYAGRNYFKTQILQEDLAIWLLAYSWSLATLPALILLFVAMYCVYEIGYWHNDHIASKKEASPTLSKSHAKFDRYPIRFAYLWSLALSVSAAVWLCFLFPAPFVVLFRFAREWFVILVVLDLAFSAFNHLPIQRRPYVFPILHFIKNMAAATLIPLHWLGATLLFSQIASQMMVYIAHRSGGSGGAFNRQAQRAILFFLVLAVTFMSWGGHFDSNASVELGKEAARGVPTFPAWFLEPVWQNTSLQFALILLWMAFRIVQRAYGRGIVGIMRKALGR